MNHADLVCTTFKIEKDEVIAFNMMTGETQTVLNLLSVNKDYRGLITQAVAMYRILVELINDLELCVDHTIKTKNGPLCDRILDIIYELYELRDTILGRTSPQD